MDKYPKYISEEQQELFERFLMGEISAEEKSTFKERLSKDKDLQKSFNEFKALFETVEEAGIRSKIQDFHNTLEQKKTQVKQLNASKIKFNYRIAASIAILLTAGGIWFFNQPSPNQKLFDDYFSPDPGLPTVMGSNDNYAFYEAMVDYKQGNYDVAIEKWEKLLVTKPENDTLNYFLGSAYLANNKTTKAISFFENTLKGNLSAFTQETHYYLGLIHLKKKNIKAAKQSFEKSNTRQSEKILLDLKN